MSKIDNSQIDRQKYHEDLVKYADKALENDDFPKVKLTFSMVWAIEIHPKSTTNRGQIEIERPKRQQFDLERQKFDFGGQHCYKAILEAKI